MPRITISIYYQYYMFSTLFANHKNSFAYLLPYFQQLENYNEAARLFQNARTAGNTIERFAFNQMLHIYGKLKVLIYLQPRDQLAPFITTVCCLLYVHSLF